MAPRSIHDGKILREATADLQKFRTSQLVDYFRYLIQSSDLARIQSVGAVFAG
jgi:hypothetical protein